MSSAADRLTAWAFAADGTIHITKGCDAPFPEEALRSSDCPRAASVSSSRAVHASPPVVIVSGEIAGTAVKDGENRDTDPLPRLLAELDRYRRARAGMGGAW